jgi:hypothetical protein
MLGFCGPDGFEVGAPLQDQALAPKIGRFTREMPMVDGDPEDAFDYRQEWFRGIVGIELHPALN